MLLLLQTSWYIYHNHHHLHLFIWLWCPRLRSAPRTRSQVRLPSASVRMSMRDTVKRSEGSPARIISWLLNGSRVEGRTSMNYIVTVNHVKLFVGKALEGGVWCSKTWGLFASDIEEKEMCNALCGLFQIEANQKSCIFTVSRVELIYPLVISCHGNEKNKLLRTYSIIQWSVVLWIMLVTVTPCFFLVNLLLLLLLLLLLSNNYHVISSSIFQGIPGRVHPAAAHQVFQLRHRSTPPRLIVATAFVSVCLLRNEKPSFQQAG